MEYKIKKKKHMQLDLIQYQKKTWCMYHQYSVVGFDKIQDALNIHVSRKEQQEHHRYSIQ